MEEEGRLYGAATCKTLADSPHLRLPPVGPLLGLFLLIFGLFALRKDAVPTFSA